LRGRRFRLLPVRPAHYPALYDLTVEENVAFRWRHRGFVPTFDQFVRSFNASVLIQFVVVPVAEPSQVAGLVVAYNANLVDQVAYLAIVSAPGIGAGVLEGMVLFIRYLFWYWPLRKLYFEMPEFNLEQFRGAVRAGLLVEEARLTDCVYLHNRFWDKLILSLTRDTADTLGPRFETLLQS